MGVLKHSLLTRGSALRDTSSTANWLQFVELFKFADLHIPVSEPAEGCEEDL